MTLLFKTVLVIPTPDIALRSVPRLIGLVKVRTCFTASRRTTPSWRTCLRKLPRARILDMIAKTK